jgi:lysophospholipase L1-like esterase
MPLAVVLGVVALACADSAGASTGPPYYVSLGDSLAQGVQPNATGQSVITNQGYADDLYSLERLRAPGLRLAKLGCPGETTTSMIHGGGCNGVYTSGNQLDDAIAFLQSHDVALVTLDIGANNVDGCITGATISASCVSGGIATAGKDLLTILQRLRAAAPGVPIVGMNYYDPFLAEWLQGPAGQSLARQSVQLSTFFNGVLDADYALFSIPVADVESSFQTTDFASIPFVGLPVNVGLICTLTWMCAPSPVGPNIHANAAGYWVIAGTFARTIGRLAG